MERALHDEELRDHVKQAYSAARDIYEELIAPRGVTTVAQRFASDGDIQDSLRTAVDELRQAANRLQGRREREHHGARTFIFVAGVVSLVLFNPVTGPETRRWLKNTLFGGGDFDFETGPNGAAG